jgi:5-formyltetrahydrofolate cyclo-ligase
MNISLMHKQELRKIYSTKRNALSQQEVNDFEQFAIHKLTLFLQKKKDIHCLATYYPIKKNNEPDAYTIALKSITVQSNNIIVCLPKIDTANTMQFYKTDSNTPLTLNQWDIAEPPSNNIIAHTQIDIMLVPLLCFTSKGYRVGYGKGFYDHYIAQAKYNLITIGLSYFEAVDNIDDIHENDVPLNYVITPQQFYECT